MRVNSGFAFNYIQNGCRLPEGYANGGWKKQGYHGSGSGPRGIGATGGMWAFRRPAFDTVGGLLDKCILGHGDWFMAFGLVGEEAPDMHVQGYSADYRATIAAWQRNAAKLKKNVGYVDGFGGASFSRVEGAARLLPSGPDPGAQPLRANHGFAGGLAGNLSKPAG